eukprot:TRINITY_DN1421_c0_g1_i1.p2 TRINITY_DN1421_c0_g1~~TRINITY_DN1421_c0_g1_i1.p2  ORF type:complete len:156 (-),score=6.25 TRINITY_DN1421_c0_g1_i1:164-631(-)
MMPLWPRCKLFERASCVHSLPGCLIAAKIMIIGFAEVVKVPTPSAVPTVVLAWPGDLCRVTYDGVTCPSAHTSIHLRGAVASKNADKSFAQRHISLCCKEQLGSAPAAVLCFTTVRLSPALRCRMLRWEDLWEHVPAWSSDALPAVCASSGVCVA